MGDTQPLGQETSLRSVNTELQSQRKLNGDSQLIGERKLNTKRVWNESYGPAL